MLNICYTIFVLPKEVNFMLETFLLIISVLLIVVVLLQGNKASSAGQIITGGNDVLFQNMKERGFELFISRLTLILGILFFIISLILFLKYYTNDK